MRCPRCGGVLEAKVDKLICPRGEMELSWVLRQELERWVADGSIEVPRAKLCWGGVWHCPRDDALMRESDGRATCPDCGRHLSGRVLYMMIEFHTHAPIAPLDDVRN